MDIETTDLGAVGAGFILCAVVQPYHGKQKTFRYDEVGDRPAHERKLLRALFAELAEYDMWVGHNIERFDWPFLRSRASILGVAIPFTPPFAYDTLHAFRRMQYRTRPNRDGRPMASLAHVVDFFGIPQLKTGIYPRQHWVSVWGKDKDQRAEALDHIVAHCQDDVKMNELVYDKLLAVDTRAVLRRCG